MAAHPATPSPTDAAQPGIWWFGSAMLDERMAALRVGGEHVELDRSSYDVLLILLRHAGAVITKDELLEAGWPGRVVSENSLSKAVGRLRQALAGDGKALRAVHGYGYRLAIETRFQPVAIDKIDAHPQEAARLRAGDRLPQRHGWRLRQRLGEGSAGVIFLAESEQGEQRAVKLATSEAGLRSLKREIALSRYIESAHPGLPGIAPVLGWNLSHTPFFLELPYYPHGNLRDWAMAQGRLRALDTAQRLAMCVQLCESVAALHEIGVIHKDLKPENLYPIADDSGSDWRIVLADLGAAEAALSPQLGITLSLAEVHGGTLSPNGGSMLYIAPEVIAGETPTQRSDVFALGVLIYQLVVGDLRASLAPGWEAAIGDPLLREDIATAAALDPAERLLDARALAGHLHRLEERRAQRRAEAEREDTEVQHARQLIASRNRRRLWAAVSATLALGLLSTSLMYASAQRQRRTAEETVSQRQAVLDFVTRDILGQADPYGGDGSRPELSMRAAIDKAASHAGSTLGDDPAAAAAVHQMLGAIYFGQDKHDAAIAEFEKARALYRSLGGRHAAALVQVETALCDVHRIGDHLVEAEAACDSALARARATGSGVALATLKLGQLRGEQGRYPQAQAILQPLLRDKVFDDDRKALGELHWALGLGARALGQYPQARDHFSALLAISRDGGQPDSWTAWAYNSLGSVLVELGDYARAETMLLSAQRLFAQTQGADQIETQMPQAWRADIRLRRGEWDEAKVILRGMLQAWESRLQPGHSLRLRAEASLAWAEAMSGEQALAARHLQAAIDARAIHFDKPDDRTAATRTLRWVRTALALDQQARAGELLALFDARLRPTLADPHPLRAEADCLRAQWARRGGDDGTARRLAASCRNGLVQFYPVLHPLVAEASALLAALEHDARRLPDAG